MSRRRTTPPGPVSSEYEEDITRPSWQLDDADPSDRGAHERSAYYSSADVPHEMAADLLDQRFIDRTLALIDVEQQRIHALPPPSTIEEQEARALRLLDLRRKRERLRVEATHSGLRGGSAAPIRRPIPPPSHVETTPVSRPPAEPTYVVDATSELLRDPDEDVGDHDTLVPDDSLSVQHPRWKGPDADTRPSTTAVLDVRIRNSDSAPATPIARPLEPSALDYIGACFRQLFGRCTCMQHPVTRQVFLDPHCPRHGVPL